MKNLHIIPTDKPSLGKYLVFNKEGNLCIWETNTMGSQRRLLRQNIYITSDEEIKEGDWCYDIFLQAIFQANSFMGIKTKNTAKKITLTTDQDLINDGIEQISEDTLLKIVEHINSGKNIESFDEL